MSARTNSNKSEEHQHQAAIALGCSGVAKVETQKQC